MNKKNAFFSLILALAVLTLTVSSCKEDEPQPIKLASMTIGTIDLNGAIAPTTVPLEPVIVATFTTDVDAATATAANITLVQNYDTTSVAIDITVDGTVLTVTPVDPLASGTLYRLTISSAVTSTDGLSIGDLGIKRTFTTAGTFVPTGQIAYWSFEDNANDVVGAYDPAVADVIGITYTASRKTAAGKAATFNGTTSIIEVPNGDALMNTTSFTIAFWVKTSSAGKTNGHFVMGLGGSNGFQYEIFGGYDGSKFAFQYAMAGGTSAAEDMWFPALADLGWQGWTFAKSITAAQMMAYLKDAWTHVTYTYNAGEKVGTLYFNGEKMKTFDFDSWPAGEAKRAVSGLKYAGSALGNQLAFGFIQARNNRIITDTWADYADPANNHFKGQLDDIRIFHKALKSTEITLMYNSEKP